MLHSFDYICQISCHIARCFTYGSLLCFKISQHYDREDDNSSKESFKKTFSCTKFLPGTVWRPLALLWLTGHGFRVQAAHAYVRRFERRTLKPATINLVTRLLRTANRDYFIHPSPGLAGDANGHVGTRYVERHFAQRHAIRHQHPGVFVRRGAARKICTGSLRILQLSSQAAWSLWGCLRLFVALVSKPHSCLPDTRPVVLAGWSEQPILHACFFFSASEKLLIFIPKAVLFLRHAKKKGIAKFFSIKRLPVDCTWSCISKHDRPSPRSLRRTLGKKCYASLHVRFLHSVRSWLDGGWGRDRERELAVGFDLRFNLANWPVV